MKKTHLFWAIIFIIIGCDHYFILFHKDTKMEIYSLRHDCFAIKMGGTIIRHSELSIEVDIDPFKNISVQLYNLRIDVFNHHLSYHVWHKGKIIDNNYIDLSEVEHFSFSTEYGDKFKEGDEIMVSGDDFVKCGNECYDLDTIRFIVK